MSHPACSLKDVLTCGHEWPKEAAVETAQVVKDAHGTALAGGDTVVLIKDLNCAADRAC